MRVSKSGNDRPREPSENKNAYLDRLPVTSPHDTITTRALGFPLLLPRRPKACTVDMPDTFQPVENEDGQANGDGAGVVAIKCP